MKPFSIWIGYDTREQAAFDVARDSIKKRLTIKATPVKGIMLDDVMDRGLYWRPTERRENVLWDTISEAPMSTEFAISRFLTPHLAVQGGYAAFLDCDVLAKGNLNRLPQEIREIEIAQGKKAVYCVKHDHKPAGDVKMDGQPQTCYGRKNWSSVMVFDCEHPSNQKLSLDLINGARGLDLHQFCWLNDDEIGELDPKWNYLVGYTARPADAGDPKIVHFTSGGPWMVGYQSVEYADDWRRELRGFVCR